jgi:nitrogenase molybdenum-cofactor synthesis protein NifE
MNEPFSITVKELAALGADGMPRQFIPSCGLVYSSPATLSYNSPGALGFGVKRAALAIPESVMLLVAPDCCGRNSTILSSSEGYSRRMFYLRMDETDLVTGRHLTMIPEAVREVCAVAVPRPKVVVICITCVDALLGTDLERVCRKAADETGVYIVPSYMYALTREGRKPPMMAVRQTIYSLLEKKTKQADMVNLLGFFSALEPESELFALLSSAGVKKINQAGTCRTLDEYMEMGAANFNLVLYPESRFAADDLMKRLGIPYIELTRLYDIEKIRKQYELFSTAIGAQFELDEYQRRAEGALESFRSAHSACSFAIGQMINASPFELALSLVHYGFTVRYILATPGADDFAYMNRLAALSPETLVYPPTDSSMMNFVPAADGIDIAVGKDIVPYFPRAAYMAWNSELQPFGFRAVADFFTGCGTVLKEIASGGAK